MKKIVTFLFVFQTLFLIPNATKAAMSCSPSNFVVVMASSNTTSQSITLPTSVPNGALLVLGVYNRTENGATVNSVTDTLNGSTGWTQGSSHSNSWFYYKTNSNAGNLTITANFSSPINNHLVAGWCNDVDGVLVYDSAASTLIFPGLTAVNSNTVTTSNAGGIVGFVATDGAVTFVTNGSGETKVSPNFDSFQRVHMFHELYNSSGTYGFQTTASSLVSGAFHVLSFRVGGAVTPSPTPTPPPPTPTPTPPPPAPTPTPPPPTPTPTPTPPPPAPVGTRTFDTSEYRQNTYGAPNRYCDPTRALTSNGSGTLADPWNLSQCAALPVAGDVVGVMPGVSVVIPVSSSNRIPAFDVRASGTSDTNRIIYVTKYAAIGLPNVDTNPLRTQLRHSGTGVAAAGNNETGTGSSIYGSYWRSYVTFDGFYIDMAQAEPAADSGVIRVENAVGVHFRNFVIKGTNTNMQSNPIIYRPQDAVGTVLSNFRVYDFYNDTTGSNVPQAALFSDQYGDRNFLMENFDIRNTQRGIFLKGTAGSSFNYGTIRNGIVSQVESCYQFNDLDPNNLTTLENSLCYDVTSGAGIKISSETSPGRNLLIHHVTVARVNSSSPNTAGCIYSRANGITTNVTIRDILCDINNGTYGHGVDFSEISGLPSLMNFNAYYKNGSNLTWAYNGVQQNSISSWRTATNRDANSQVLTSSPFVNRAAGDFRISAGHPAKTMSSTGGEIGTYGVTTETVGPILPTGTYPSTGSNPPPPPPHAAGSCPAGPGRRPATQGQPGSRRVAP
jgi:hypothetical protein